MIQPNVSRALEQIRSVLPAGHKSTIHHTNVNVLHDDSLTFGQRVADGVARNMGSWRFIIAQSCILVCWVILNAAELLFHPFDPYPFILLNLALSFQAAYAAPIIMMSQNRQADKDRLAAEHDYCVNIRGEATIHAVLNHLQAQDEVMLAMLRQLEAIHGITPNPEQQEAERRLAGIRTDEAQILEKTIREAEEKLGLTPI